MYRQRTLYHGTGPQRVAIDSYGCTQFSPPRPSNEDTTTLEEKRFHMVSIYQREGLDGGERSEIIHNMEITYSIQRADINATPPPSIQDLKMRWPFLFSPRGIYAHFEHLTDVKVLQVLELSMEECGRAVVEFFRTEGNRDLMTMAIQGANRDLTYHVIQLVMAHFGENPDGLMFVADVSVGSQSTHSPVFRDCQVLSVVMRTKK